MGCCGTQWRDRVPQQPTRRCASDPVVRVHDTTMAGKYLAQFTHGDGTQNLKVSAGQRENIKNEDVRSFVGVIV